MVAPGCSLEADYYARKCSSQTENRRFEGKRATKSTASAVIPIQRLKVTAEPIVLSRLYNSNRTITGVFGQGLDVCNFLLSLKWFRISRFHNKHLVVLSLLSCVVIVGKLQSPEINLVQCDL